MKVLRHQFVHEGVATSLYEYGEGETLIFLPGWGATFSMYQKLLNELSTKFHVVYLDLPGFGKSDAPKKVWDFSEYATYVAAFLDSRPETHVMLSGHSFGGAIALYTAVQNKKVKKLILFDTTGLPLEYNPWRFYLIYLKELILDLLNPYHVQRTILVIPAFLSSLKNIIYRIRLAKKVFRNEVKNQHALPEEMNIPSCIFWGDNDFVFTKKIANKINTILHGETVYFVNGSHNWVIFKPHLIKTYLNLL